ncbi:MAG TPA: hypothetical protein VN958_03975 [Chitinophagaceae bacterium]|nr:hypothetical protein [Chitinophagaceae bacterium]
MTNDQIEKFVESKKFSQDSAKIHFKTRNAMLGVFIKSADYDDLKSKNFWRIVTGSNLENWKKTKDNNLARIFNGAEITKLTDQ